MTPAGTNKFILQVVTSHTRDGINKSMWYVGDNNWGMCVNNVEIGITTSNETLFSYSVSLSYSNEQEKEEIIKLLEEAQAIADGRQSLDNPDKSSQ